MAYPPRIILYIYVRVCVIYYIRSYNFTYGSTQTRTCNIHSPEFPNLGWSQQGSPQCRNQQDDHLLSRHGFLGTSMVADDWLPGG